MLIIVDVFRMSVVFRFVFCVVSVVRLSVMLMWCDIGSLLDMLIFYRLMFMVDVIGGDVFVVVDVCMDFRFRIVYVCVILWCSFMVMLYCCIYCWLMRLGVG